MSRPESDPASLEHLDHMELKAHFSNIHQVIIGHLQLAQTEIVAAVAWFTDSELFEVLCRKVRAGVKVSVVLIADEINRGPHGLNFSLLGSLGGQVLFLSAASRNEPIMHHKFCVIDGATVITGSYNWSHRARSNDENITVVTGHVDFADKYLDAFSSLIARAGREEPVVIDTDAAKRRLELIRNLIMLGEQGDIVAHVRKLRPVADGLHLSQIIKALDDGRYQVAIEEINAYLQRLTALVSTEFVDVSRLRFQLEALELRLESLTDEKAELERRLITFNRRHDEALGDVIQRLLKARAELARLIAAERSESTESSKRHEAEADAETAEDAYQEYSGRHEELKRAEPLPALNEDSERELKSFYRKACSLCHPDKFSDDGKESAHHAFVELQEAYKSNDLLKVREIYEVLIVGGMPGTRSTTLSKVEALTTAIAEVEYAISRQVGELKALHASEAAKLMRSAGQEEFDWQRFFDRQRERFDDELARIVSCLIDRQREG